MVSFALTSPAQGGDGDQAGGEDEGGPEEGGAHQLEEDRQDHHQILEVPSSYWMLDKYSQKARHKRRRSPTGVLGA